MSGICSIWWTGNARGAAATLTAMNAGLALDRPENAAIESEQEAGVGVSSGFPEQQIYRRGHILLACDADLTNRKELAESVGGQPEVPAGAHTAAMLAGLYERLGCAFVEKLRGGFSVVLWDARERRLMAAIDGFGIKRLVYYRDQEVLLVASRIGALARCERVAMDVNPKAIANVLNFTSNLAPETIFKRVERLIPGAMLVMSEGGPRVERYWDMRYGETGDRNAGRLSLELEATMDRSVTANAQDKPAGQVGAYLSGGTDSSTVVGLMARHSQTPVKAFSIGFEDQEFDELGYAELAARKFEAEHHTYHVTAQDCFEAIPSMVRYFDEPYGNASAIPTYFCARLAAQNGVKTLLAGDGGDELFGGNERYATDKIFEVYHRVPQFFRRGLLEPILAASPIKGGLVRRARGYVRRANMRGVERMLSFQFLRTHALNEIFQGDFLRELGDYTVVDIPARHYAQATAKDHLDRLLYVDVKNTLGDNDLPKVTCMSELAGIATRFPYLDRDVAEFSGRIPVGLKVKGFEKRHLFKRAFRNLLPIEIITKKKHGFGIPVSRWIHSDKRMSELARDTLLSSRASSRGYFRQAFIEDLFHKSETDKSPYYGDTIWTFLALELWHRQAVDEPARVTA